MHFILFLCRVVIQRLDSRLEKGKLKPKDTDSLLDTWIRDGHQDYRQLLTLLSDLMLAGIDTVRETCNEGRNTLLLNILDIY